MSKKSVDKEHRSKSSVVRSNKLWTYEYSRKYSAVKSNKLMSTKEQETRK